MIRSLKKSLQPAMTDVTVSYQLPSGLTAQHAPQEIPAVFNNEKLVLYAVLRKSKPDVAVSREGVAKLKGTLLGKKMEYCVRFNLSVADGSGSSIPIVHHLAAKQLLREWGEEGDKRKKEIISLSIESNVVSAHTAYIAIDENQQKPIEGALQTWDLSSSIASHSMMYGASVVRCSAAIRNYSSSGPLMKKKKGNMNVVYKLTNFYINF